MIRIRTLAFRITLVCGIILLVFLNEGQIGSFSIGFGLAGLIYDNPVKEQKDEHNGNSNRSDDIRGDGFY